jgi:D-alanyl-D-alanine carboxypeptidase
VTDPGDDAARMTAHQPAPTRRRFRQLAIALLAVAAVGGATPGSAAAAFPVPVSSPALDSEPEPEPVPACTRGDDPAPFRRYDRWRSTFLDTRYRVARTYVPPRLAPTADAGTNGGSRVRRLVIEDLRALVRAARRQGITIRVNSGYRSYAEQRAMYRAEVDRVGAAEAALLVARPGHSEHQLGTALDIADTAGAHAWLAERAWRFGFVVSYPRGGRDISCYRYEPWHVRYYGRTRAAAIHETGLVPRAWLWSHVVNVAR